MHVDTEHRSPHVIEQKKETGTHLDLCVPFVTQKSSQNRLRIVAVLVVEWCCFSIVLGLRLNQVHREVIMRKEGLSQISIYFTHTTITFVKKGFDILLKFLCLCGGTECQLPFAGFFFFGSESSSGGCCFLGSFA